MTVPARIRGAGDAAVLVELDDAATRRRLHRSLLHHPAPGVVELVPAAVTIGLQCAGPDELQRAVDHVLGLLDAGLDEDVVSSGEVGTIEVSYDGEDLAQVADICGITAAEVVERHTGQVWTVDFAGFMPGFGYLSGSEGGLTVPRLQQPRTRIPPGSVALAGDFTGIYPQASPGGWQLIGHTDAVLWDPRRTSPALLEPGAAFRFVAVQR